MSRRRLGAKTMRRRVWRDANVAFGGNVGDVPATFLRALEFLQGQDIELTVMSGLFKSLPLRLPKDRSPHAKVPPKDEVYTNAVVGLRTLLGPREVLARLQAIEAQLGRTRRELWGPRTLDLDLLTYDGICMKQRILTLPHPGMPFRAFVLLPLYAINALRPWPNLILSVNDLLWQGSDATWGIVHRQLSWRWDDAS